MKASCFTIVNSVVPEILLKNAIRSWSSFFLGTVWPQRTETTQTVDYNSSSMQSFVPVSRRLPFLPDSFA